MEENDAQLQLKKRARRRLVGAVAFASVVAVVLPVIMDHEPGQNVQDVEIRIPGQDEKPLAPRFAVAPVEQSGKEAVKAQEAPAAENPPEKPAAAPTARVIDNGREKPAEQPKVPDKEAPKDKPAAKPTEKAPEKAAEKPADKSPAKPEKSVEKAPEKSAPSKDKDAEAKRAAAILAGQNVSAAEAAPNKSGEYVILIGAFANEENVKNIKAKLAEKNVKTYSEPLQTPTGTKTRVRAGPFPSRDAAEKALERMKQVGVSGVIAGK